ncbi:MAG TPA: hypothetical protein VGN34_19830 [Ktedonobacteraceae bacterium]
MKSRATRHAPEQKVYEITEAGRAMLRQWVESPTLLVIARDEFFLKAYSLWLADPERMMVVFREQLQFHEERLAHHEQVLQAKRSTEATPQENTDFLALTELLFTYTIGYEQNYIAWYHSALHYLEQYQHTQKEGN